MPKPIIRAIAPFDATVGTTIEFTWSGRQMKSNVATIVDASTGATVFVHEQAAFKGVNNIPASSGLQNNKSYKVSITITDMDDVVSEASEQVLFYCYTIE